MAQMAQSQRWNRKTLDYLNVPNQWKYATEKVPVIIRTGGIHGERVTSVLQAVNPSIDVVYKAKDLEDGVNYAIKHGIKLFNYSYYDHLQADIKRFTPVMDDLPDDLIIVAASGNWGGAVTFPANHPNVIAVANYDIHRNEINKASNIGPEIEIAAPGRWVVAENGHEINGTSYACPTILAAISIFQTQFKKINGRYPTRKECREFLRKNSKDVLQPGWDELSGHGLFVFKDNWTEDLKRGEELKLLSNVNYLVVHHSASGDVDVNEIRRWHLDRGFSDVGYHWVVRQNGTIEKGRDERYQGAHSVPVNAQSIGICCTGDFTKQTMPTVQKTALITLLRQLKQRYPNAQITQHKDHDTTACPGNIPIDEIRREVLNVSNKVFNDVPDGNYESAKAIKWCKERGLLRGDEKGNFNPSAPVTREQLALVLYRQANKQ